MECDRGIGDNKGRGWDQINKVERIRAAVSCVFHKSLWLGANKGINRKKINFSMCLMLD